MARSVQTDDDFDDQPKPLQSEKHGKSRQSTFESRVRAEVIKSPEDWLVPKYISQVLRSGAAHVSKVLEKMVSEGFLSPLQAVPKVDDEEVKVGRSPVDGGHFDVNAFLHKGEWVIGYFGKSAADARKTVLIHARPELTLPLGISRARAGYSRHRGRRSPTPGMKERYANSFRFKAADWDGMAYFVLRDDKPYIDACIAAGIEPKTNLPWTCKCGRVYKALDTWCRTHGCNGKKPSLLETAVQPKVCPDCGQPDVDGHSKRHHGKKFKKAKMACLNKVIDLVHGR